MLAIRGRRIERLRGMAGEIEGEGQRDREERGEIEGDG